VGPASGEIEKAWKLAAPQLWGTFVHSSYAGVKILVTVNGEKIYRSE
jgi:hypothetical protein